MFSEFLLSSLMFPKLLIGEEIQVRKFDAKARPSQKQLGSWSLFTNSYYDYHFFASSS